MATANKKKRLVRELAMYFAEKGRIPTPKEYDRDPARPNFVNLREISKTVGSWPTLLKMVKMDHPQLWEMTQPKIEDPLAKLRASITEK